MFVKWSTTKTTGRLVASLSEGHRINGAVRQQHISMLGTLRPADPRRPTPAETAAFWEQAQAALNRLEDRLEAGQRAVVVARLHARVPMPGGGNSVS
jgi:hypothetical protein